MKFNSVFVGIILLVGIYFLFMYNNRSHRSMVKKEEIIVHLSPSSSSSSSQFWIILLLSLNLLTGIMIWFKLPRSSRTEIEMKSVEQQTTPEVISDANDRVAEEPVKCFDSIHINRSTAKILINEMIVQVKRARKFAFLIKPHTRPHQKLRICIEVMQLERSLFLSIDYDHAEDFHTLYASSLRQIFRSVFQLSNQILTSGNLGAQLKSFAVFQLFSYDQVMRAYSIDEQNSSRNGHHDMVSDQAKRFLTCSCTLCENSWTDHCVLRSFFSISFQVNLWTIIQATSLNSVPIHCSRFVVLDFSHPYSKVNLIGSGTNEGQH